MKIYAAISPPGPGYKHGGNEWVKVEEINEKDFESLDYGGGIAVLVRRNGGPEIHGCHYDFCAVRIEV